MSNTAALAPNPEHQPSLPRTGSDLRSSTIPRPLAKAALDFWLALQTKAGVDPRDAIEYGVALVGAGWTPQNADGLLTGEGLKDAGVGKEDDRIKIAKALTEWKMEIVEKRLGELSTGSAAGTGQNTPVRPSPVLPASNTDTLHPVLQPQTSGTLHWSQPAGHHTSNTVSSIQSRVPVNVDFLPHSRIKSGPVPLPNTGPGVASLTRKEHSLSQTAPTRTLTKGHSFTSVPVPNHDALDSSKYPMSLKAVHHTTTLDPLYSSATHPTRPALARANSYQNTSPTTASPTTPPKIRPAGEPAAGTALRKITTRPVLAICLHPTEPSRLFVATQGEVSEWSVPYASTESPVAPVATYNGHSEPVHALAISPAHSALYTASGKEVREFPLSGPPTRIASRTFKCHGTVSSLHPTGDKLFAGCGDKTVREHDLRTGLEKTWKLAGIFDRAHPVPQVSLSSDSRSLFAALGDGVVRIDLWSDERIGKIRAAAIGERDGGSADVLDFATSPDGRYLVSAGSDGMAREHLIATGITTRVFNHGSAVRKVRVFEGRLFTVSATETKEWDLGTGECKGVLRTGGVDAVLVVVGVKRGEGVQGEVRRIWVGGEQGVGEWAV